MLCKGCCQRGALPLATRARLLAARVVSWMSCRGRAGAAQGGPPGARGSKLPLKAAPVSSAGEVAVLDPCEADKVWELLGLWQADKVWEHLGL